MSRVSRLSLIGCCLMAACSYVPSRSIVAYPTSMRPELPNADPPTNGAIYQAGVSRPLFEDRRARFAGDTLVVHLEEKIQGSKNSATTAKRTHEISATAPSISGIPGKSFQGMSLGANSKSDFSGSGESSATNDLTGTIACTVTQVLSNGNLVIAGEKRIGLNHNQDTIRFSGIVNPLYITGSNTVSSSQIADARIEYRGTGQIDEAQAMGWLARFFLNVSPF